MYQFRISLTECQTDYPPGTSKDRALACYAKDPGSIPGQDIFHSAGCALWNKCKFTPLLYSIRFHLKIL